MLCYCLSVVIVLCCYLCCSVIIVLFYVLIVCTVTLPPGVNPIAVDKYIIYHIFALPEIASRLQDACCLIGRQKKKQLPPEPNRKCWYATVLICHTINTADGTRAKSVVIKTWGYEKILVTVTLAVSADGSTLSP